MNIYVSKVGSSYAITAEAIKIGTETTIKDIPEHKFN